MATATKSADRARARLGELEDQREELRERARSGGRVSAEQLGKLAGDIEVAALEVQAAQEADQLKAEADRNKRIQAIRETFHGGEVAGIINDLAQKEEAAVAALHEAAEAAARYEQKRRDAHSELRRLGCEWPRYEKKADGRSLRVPEEKKPPVTASPHSGTVEVDGTAWYSENGAGAVLAIAALALLDRPESELGNGEKSLGWDMQKKAGVNSGDIRDKNPPRTISAKLARTLDRVKARTK